LKRLARFLAVLAMCALLGGTGLALGYVAAKRGTPSYILAAYLRPARQAVRRWFGVRETSRWQTMVTHLGVVETTRVSVGEYQAPPAALVELDGHLLFMSRHGVLSYLNAARELRSLDTDVPMHLDALRQSEVGRDPLFNIGLFRAFDLLASETAPHTFDVFASYNRYSGTCFETVVSRMRVETTGGAVTPRSAWEQVWVATPCVPPQREGSIFGGHVTGGRLARLDAMTVLLSVGDQEFEGTAGRHNGPQDPTWDLGKIIAIDLRTGQSERWAAGFRNPQGLLVDRQGRVWETEHGPQGGDEINLIRRGGNYGWPSVTYGMSYTARPQNWPLNTTYGGHEGFDRPAMVFTPAIGISQIVQPSTDEFPFWESVLLVASLRGGALYVLRLDDDRIVFAEPIVLGERIRDLITRANGELAMITDAGSLMLMRRQRDDNAQGFAITDLRLPPRSQPADAARTPVVRGRDLFTQACATCHSVAGADGPGPPLDGVVDRQIGAVTTFGYSDVLRTARGKWSEGRLSRFLVEPEAEFSGARMPASHLSDAQARELVAYLRTTRAP
jgi:cytochrome c2